MSDHDEGGTVPGPTDSGQEPRQDRRDEPVEPEEFIRRRPEESPEQGPGAGPGAPETLEPTQGERIPPREAGEGGGR